MNLFYLTQDINFQKALLLVAIIALILAILVSAYNLNSVVDVVGQSWPPSVALCPDYWDLSGAYCINASDQNLGSSNALYTTTDNTHFIPLSAIGVDRNKKHKNRSKNSKKNWASLNGFVWDGLTSD
jgi:hypothetical protein